MPPTNVIKLPHILHSWSGSICPRISQQSSISIPQISCSTQQKCKMLCGSNTSQIQGHHLQMQSLIRPFIKLAARVFPGCPRAPLPLTSANDSTCDCDLSHSAPHVERHSCCSSLISRLSSLVSCSSPSSHSVPSLITLSVIRPFDLDPSPRRSTAATA